MTGEARAGHVRRVVLIAECIVLYQANLPDLPFSVNCMVQIPPYYSFNVNTIFLVTSRYMLLRMFNSTVASIAIFFKEGELLSA